MNNYSNLNNLYTKINFNYSHTINFKKLLKTKEVKKNAKF